MKNEIVDEIFLKLAQVAKFVRFNRQEIKKEIEKLLHNLDKHVDFLNEANGKLKKENITSKKIIADKEEEFSKIIIENKNLSKTINKVERNLLRIQDKYDLVSNLLDVKGVVNDGLKKFKGILYGEFLEFANKESSLAEEAEAILKLQGVEKELELIVNFPSVHSKSIIAIGGGFSSGKSAFINSFFEQNSIELPIGIEPVTAIPTYVISGSQSVIRGFSQNGNAIDIDKEFYKKLSHEFVKSFKFNLKNIMPFMTISTPLSNEYFENICLIDTPGYNPAASDRFTSEDKKTAFEFLEQANALIWMIGLDSNGTIPESDLKFINELNLFGKKLFIVANKSDLRAENDLKKIVKEIKESLNDYDIEHHGISAFSANTKQEYLYSDKSLFDFLKQENNPVMIQETILDKVDVVFKMYNNAIKTDIKDIKKYKANINSLELDLLETGYDNDNSKLNNRLNKMKKSMDPTELNKQLQELALIKNKFIIIINEIFDELTNKVEV